MRIFALFILVHWATPHPYNCNISLCLHHSTYSGGEDKPAHLAGFSSTLQLTSPSQPKVIAGIQWVCCFQACFPLVGTCLNSSVIVASNQVVVMW